MLTSLKEFLEKGILFDSGIVAHGFTPSLRDYDVIIEAISTAGNVDHGWVEGRYRFRFTHCPLARTETAVADNVWRQSWSDVFTDVVGWESAGQPPGYVWGVNYADVYPGAILVTDSELAIQWSRRFAQPMYEVQIHTNCQNLQLVFHRLVATRLSRGMPSGDITPLAVEEPIYAGPDA